MKFFTINYLIVDVAFKDFLISSNNKINRMILSVDTMTDINFLAPGDKPDMVSYLASNKKKKVSECGIDPFENSEIRSNMKIGRLVSKLYTKQQLEEFRVTPKDIESFVNSYKSFFDLDGVEFKVVSGDEIKKWYHFNNYSFPESGTLWKSCMRHHDKQPYLTLYSTNPDNIKMIVMLVKNEEGEQKVRARALLWEEVRSNSSVLKVMDRIYSLYDSDVDILKRWASKNGYITKYFQNSKTPNIFDVDGQPLVLNLSVKLPSHTHSSYPYLDSFQFYDSFGGLFYNHQNADWHYQLNRANGRLIDDEDEVNDDEFIDDDN